MKHDEFTVTFPHILYFNVSFQRFSVMFGSVVFLLIGTQAAFTYIFIQIVLMLFFYFLFVSSAPFPAAVIFCVYCS